MFRFDLNVCLKGMFYAFLKFSGEILKKLNKKKGAKVLMIIIKNTANTEMSSNQFNKPATKEIRIS